MMDDPFADLDGKRSNTSVSADENPFAAYTKQSLFRRRRRAKLMIGFTSLIFTAVALLVIISSGKDSEVANVTAGNASQEPSRASQSFVPENDSGFSDTEVSGSEVEGQDFFSVPSNLEGLISVAQSATLELGCFPDEESDDGNFGTAFFADISTLSGSMMSEIVLLTSSHVIEDCRMSGVILVGKKDDFHVAEIEKVDEENDLALLKAPGLSAPPLSTSIDVRTGQWVMATGNPEGIAQAVTFGQVTGLDPEDGWIASDALVGPGNSGGPLVNNRGQVIAVVGARYREITGLSSSAPLSHLCMKLIRCT